jgi:hypothetical protein
VARFSSRFPWPEPVQEIRACALKRDHGDRSGDHHRARQMSSIGAIRPWSRLPCLAALAMTDCSVTTATTRSCPARRSTCSLAPQAPRARPARWRRHLFLQGHLDLRRNHDFLLVGVCGVVPQPTLPSKAVAWRSCRSETVTLSAGNEFRIFPRRRSAASRPHSCGSRASAARQSRRRRDRGRSRQ